MSIGLLCMSMDMFGYQTDKFSSFSNTGMSLFQMLFTQFYYPEMLAANSVFAPIVFIVFVLFFLYIVMKMFMAIVIKTYD